MANNDMALPQETAEANCSRSGRYLLLTGRLFKLAERTLAIEVVQNQRIAVSIPAGAVIKILLSNGDRTVDVLWESRTYRAASTLPIYHEEEVNETEERQCIPSPSKPSVG